MGVFAMTAKLALLGCGGRPKGMLWSRPRPVHPAMIEDSEARLQSLFSTIRQSPFPCSYQCPQLLTKCLLSMAGLQTAAKCHLPISNWSMA